jgi:hypothetical protein
MAEVISDVLGRPVAYRQVSLADFGSTLSQRGASEDLMHAGPWRRQALYSAMR